ncbi:MAG: FecR family protein [Pseudomonadota bacterium]
MTRPKKCIATESLAGAALLALLLCSSAALAAQVAGTVVHLSGPMQAQKPDGVLKKLSLKSEVESGDTLLTEKNTYAMVRFIDDSELTLKPGAAVTVDQFAFERGKPDADSASFTLIRGGLRSVTGLLGKRSKDKFALKTPSATIGIRGTTFIVEYIDASAPQALASLQAWLRASSAGLDGAGMPAPLLLAQVEPAIPPAAPPPGGLPPGLHVYVGDGGISITNQAGRFEYDIGQFGYIKDDKTRPVKMSTNPGLQFAPPPAFDRRPAPPADQY